MTIILEAEVFIDINWVAAENYYVAIRYFQYKIYARLKNDINNIFKIYIDQLEVFFAGYNQIRHREILDE